jgi:hypothetical protein
VCGDPLVLDTVHEENADAVSCKCLENWRAPSFDSDLIRSLRHGWHGQLLHWNGKLFCTMDVVVTRKKLRMICR